MFTINNTRFCNNSVQIKYKLGATISDRTDLDKTHGQSPENIKS